MRYMLLIYANEAVSAQRTPEARLECMNHHFAFKDAITKAGVYRASDPLHPTSAATTIRVQDGKPIASDGPFAETKEQLGGYYILDCKDLDEAISWAEKISILSNGGAGTIEIRPIMEIGELKDQIQQAMVQTV